ncbi:MAG: DUF1592 domain-containing protein [Planctomycetes bacterium]|nr:DUF1592 domain-containing protein [Planctomycetota bacterium]
MTFAKLTHCRAARTHGVAGSVLGRMLLALSMASVIESVTSAQEAPSATEAILAAAEEQAFQQTIEPLIQKYCVRCHNADEMKSGVRVDQLSAIPGDRQLFLMKGIHQQIADGAMPPEDEPTLSADQRKVLTDWITRTIAAARARDTKRNGSVRRLTVAQYRNTLKDLLGLQEDLTDAIPPDGISKDGFVNNGQTLALSPLQVETYFDIAEKSLDLCIVDERSKPVVQTFRMEFGKAINPTPCPDKLILGANNALLNNEDFIVTELKPNKPFEYQPFAMQTAFNFIEGYVGNDTIREWRKFDSINHSVFACVRGTPGYPKGEPNEVIPAGLALRPAIPSPEIFGQSNTYGPMANFKISLRELPEHGDFRITVRAARYDDGLLLDAGTPVREPDPANAVDVDLSSSRAADLTINQAGIFQVDVTCAAGKPQGLFTLELGQRVFSGQLLEPKPAAADKEGNVPDQQTAFLLVRLPAGSTRLNVRFGDGSRLRRILLTRLPDDSELAGRFQVFEKRFPSVGVHVGLRRDCGSTLTQVGRPQPVPGTDLHNYVFSGAINDFPNPEVEKDNVNYLAGIREIGVRSEYTDGRDMPRLIVRSIEFEGPYYSTWPPATHRNIFPESVEQADPAAYAQQIIRSFATRAFRRPVTDAEQAAIFAVFQRAYAEKQEFQQSVKDALLVVLTSPQFLFLIENSSSPAAEDLDPYELASKLSYFLWNTAPDQRLLDLAASQTLHASLESEVERMIRDPRSGQFISEFAAQWLSLDKLDVVATDAKRYPRLTRDTRTELRREPVQFLQYLIEQNLPLKQLIQSDFIVANEVTASYYNLASRSESGFQFVPIKHENEHLGGVLTQAGILAGLSNGRESNPIKRGAWFARKIVAEPPDDPPPNVPQIKEDEGGNLTLREKLERHRNQKGCAKCHSGIDPWGIPFESYDAGGLFSNDAKIDPSSTLPDGTAVQDLNALKTYLANDRLDQVAFSFLKHTACYAVGRSLSYNETVFLQEQGVKLRFKDYRLQDMIQFIVHSDLFLKK